MRRVQRHCFLLVVLCLGLLFVSLQSRSQVQSLSKRHHFTSQHRQPPLHGAFISWVETMSGDLRLISSFTEPDRDPTTGLVRLRLLLMATDKVAFKGHNLICWTCSQPIPGVRDRICWRSLHPESYFATDTGIHHGRPFVPIYVRCLVPDGAEDEIDVAGVGFKEWSTREVVNQGAFVPVTRFDTSASWNVTRHRLSVCAGPLFSNRHSRGASLAGQLPEWFEFYRLMGATLFKVYVTPSTDSDTRSVLAHYVKLGLAQVYEWHASEAMLQSIWANGQLSMNHDCLSRSMVDSEWVLSVDVDEYLTPVPMTNLRKRKGRKSAGDIPLTLLDALPEMDVPDLGFLKFSCWFYDRTCPLPSLAFDLTDNLSISNNSRTVRILTSQMRLKEAYPQPKRQKWMARPLGMLTTPIHAGGILAPGFKARYVTPEFGIVLRHYTRYIATPSCDASHPGRVVDSTYYPWQKDLEERVEQSVGLLRADFRFFSGDPFEETVTKV